MQRRAYQLKYQYVNTLPVSVRRHVIRGSSRHSSAETRGCIFSRIASGARISPRARLFNSPLGADVPRVRCIVSNSEWLMKLKLLLFFFCRTMTENRGVSLAISGYTMERKFLPAPPSSFSLTLSHPPSISLHSPPLLLLRFSHFVPRGLLEGHRRIISSLKRTHIGGGLRVGCPLSRCIQMMNYKYRSEPGGREGGRETGVAQRVAGKLFASRRAQKANLRMRCAIALMPVRPAGPSLDFEQV